MIVNGIQANIFSAVELLDLVEPMLKAQSGPTKEFDEGRWINGRQLVDGGSHSQCSACSHRGARPLDMEVGFDEAGVTWLDGYIQHQHEQGNPANREGLVSTLGSYLGECIIQSYEGAWAQVDG
jgi:hypothetical protein